MMYLTRAGANPAIQQGASHKVFLIGFGDMCELLLLGVPVLAGPSIVATAEGQIGEMPGAENAVLGARFESIRGQIGDVVFGGIFVFGGPMPPPPVFSFLTDTIHGTPNPVPVGSTPNEFSIVSDWVPASAQSRNVTDNGDLVAFSFAVDGAMPDTLTVRVAT